MSKNELIRESMKALERFSQLPAKEVIRRLVAKGTIDEQGRVLMGRDAEQEPVVPEGQADSAKTDAAPRVEKTP